MIDRELKHQFPGPEAEQMLYGDMEQGKLN
jgi:hypothetical protein